jgi:hypothetical protein
MKEVVWVFGNSAAGKESFIRYITSNKDERLLTSLGWQELKVTASEASMKYIGQFHGDLVTEQREQILTEVPELFENSDAVLIKWQTVDSESGRMQKLKNLLPNAQHRIILIVASNEELSERLPQKSWWDDDDVAGFIAEENKYTVNELSNLQEEFLVTKISGNSTGSYSLIEN